MSEDDIMMSERDEIEMLLPWYVTGRLSPEDKARIDAAVQRDATLARQIDLIREEMGETATAADAAKLPSGLTVQATLAHVITHSGRQAGLGARLAAALRDFLFMPGGGLRLAAAAALVALVAQAAVITRLVVAPGATYQSAGGGSGAATGAATLLVRFADGATAKAIDALLQARGMTIVDGPKPGGLYRVRIGAADLKPAEREALMAALRKESGVIAVVLPGSAPGN